MVGLSSRFILNFPIVGLLLKLWGLKAVDPNSLKSLMKEGKSIGLLPGGFEEATITSKDEMRCYINNRKGFIKYAIEHNYVVYPLLMLN
jgi:2-acylglycerol O-acyltransferase 2